MRILRGTAVALVLLVACGTQPEAEGDRALRVVASFGPLRDVSEQVGGDRVRVDVLAAAGAEPHDMELTTTQLDAILDADVFVYAGAGFQPAIERAVERRDGPTVDVLEGLPLIRPADAHDEHDHGAEELDVHAWLDPVLMVDIASTVAAALKEVDPEGAEDYEARADDFSGRLAGLHRDYDQALKNCERRVIVSGHASFGYLARRYGLEEVAVAGLSPEAEPDPQHMAEVIDVIGEHELTTVFTEPGAPPEVAEAVAREADVNVATLDPLESLGPGSTYVEAMRENLRTLEAALGCS